MLGVRGDISDAWSYDAYAQLGESQLTSTRTADFSITRLGRALDVVPDANGNPVCRSALSGVDPACVPYNVWQLNGVTPEQINYLQIPLKQDGETTQRIVNASVTGDLGQYGVKSPAAESGLLVNVGLERPALVRPGLAIADRLLSIFRSRTRYRRRTRTSRCCCAR